MTSKKFIGATLFVMCALTATLFTACSKESYETEDTGSDTQKITLNPTTNTTVEFEPNDMNYADDGSYTADFTVKLMPSDKSVTLSKEGFMIQPISLSFGKKVNWKVSKLLQTEVAITKLTKEEETGTWNVMFTVKAPDNASVFLLEYILLYNYTPVATCKVSFRNAYVVHFNELDENTMLEVGETYYTTIFDVTKKHNTEQIAEDFNIHALEILGKEHENQYAINYDEEIGKWFIKILDNFTFTDKEKAQGYAIMRLGVSGNASFKQNIAVKVPVTENE